MSVTERAELDILHEVIRIANSSPNLPRRLQRIVEITADKLHKDACSTFLLEHGTLVLRATRGLNREAVGRVRLSPGEGLVGWCFLNRESVAVQEAARDPRFRYFPISGEERYTSMLCVPIVDDEQRGIGVMVLQTLDPWRFTPDEIALVTTIASQVSGIIGNAQLYDEGVRQLCILTAIHEIAMALTSTLELDELLNMMVKHSVDLCNAQGGLLRLLNPETRRLELRAYHGLHGNLAEDHPIAMGEGIAGAVARDGAPILIEDTRRDARFVNTPTAFTSLLCVPLKVKDRVIGTISLYDKRSKDNEEAFNPEDMQLLLTLANHAAIAVENAVIHGQAEQLAQESQTRYTELSLLYDISRAMRTTLNLDRLLHIILSAVTVGGGLGFNRALLFLVDEETKTLRGALGVGPTSAEEAGAIWSHLPTVTDLAAWVDQEEAGMGKPVEESALTRLAKTVNIPISPDQGVLALTVLGKRPIHVPDAARDPRVNIELARRLDTRGFATVPLIAKDRVVGAVLVDNRYTGRPITEDDLRLLTLFANKAGLAIENAMIHSRLEAANKRLLEMQDRLIQSEKMIALGEMAAGIAHEIRNPLAVIGGFARRLGARLGPEHTQEQGYLDVIFKEVRRLEKVLQEILTFSRDARPDLTPCNLVEILQDTLTFFAEELEEHAITLKTEFPPEPLYLLADSQQIRQALINLITNSVQAIGENGVIAIRVDHSPGWDEAVLEITDSGKGISTEAMANIFNPFFTTKATGTGLGLAITRRIVVEHHGGHIEVNNKPGQGVTFRIRLPLQQVCILPKNTFGESHEREKNTCGG